ncbi:MAG: flagellar biosynthesis anti-sigma factor FlgM [Desulfobacteraceae bacterium]|nr:flagellar biosynthesis anti-sigma factor FlgM [Desulfobacteraceae bacterium]
MEIPGKGVTPINLNAYTSPVRETPKVGAGKDQQSRTGIERDKVNLSSEAKEAQKAMEMLKSMPDDNVEKVNEIKTQVDTGTYRVQGHKVAFRMMNDTFENNAVLHQFATDV